MTLCNSAIVVLFSNNYVCVVSNIFVQHQFILILNCTCVDTDVQLVENDDSSEEFDDDTDIESIYGEVDTRVTDDAESYLRNDVMSYEVFNLICKGMLLCAC